jgi:hypothetical protein
MRRSGRARVIIILSRKEPLSWISYCSILAQEAGSRTMVGYTRYLSLDIGIIQQGISFERNELNR